MKASLAQILGLVMLINTNLAIMIAFATPYWTKSLLQNDQGLWANCNGYDCVWVFDHDFAAQKIQPDWFKATQGLISAGLVMGMISLLIAMMSLHCTCHSCNSNKPISVLLVVCCLCMGTGVMIFGFNSWHVTVFSIGKFGWSFWVAAGASTLALLTSVIYRCMGRKDS